MATRASRSLSRLLIVGGIAAMVEVGLWAHISGGQANTASMKPPPVLSNGATVSCTDRYSSTWTVGPLENGKELHYVCQDGKITSWWIDGNSRMETAPQR